MMILSTRHCLAQSSLVKRYSLWKSTKWLFAICILLLADTKSQAQTTIYAESFGTTTQTYTSLTGSPSVLNGSGTGGGSTTWSFGGALSNLTLNTTNPSTSAYTGASGGAQLEDGQNTNTTGNDSVIIKNLSTVGYTSIAISFGAYRSSAMTGTFYLYYSTNGGTTWSSSALTSITAASLTSATWTFEQITSISGNALDNQSNVAFLLRFNRTSTSGNYRIDDFQLTGSASGLAPSPGSLTGFGYTVGSGPSTPQSFTLTGSNLTSGGGTITVNGSTDYEVSTDAGGTGTYYSSLGISYTGNSLAASTIWVRLKSGLSAGTYNENLTYSGGGVSSTNYPVNGNVSSSDYYSASSGDLGTLATWSSNTNGSGGTNPANFTTAGINFHIANSNPGTLTGTTTFSSNITGTGPLTFLGTSPTTAATLTLNGTNNFTGGMTIGGANTTNIGILSLPSTATSNTLPSTGTLTVNAGSCLLVAATGVSYSMPMVLNGVGNSTDAGAIRAGVASVTFTGNVTLGSNTYIYSTGTSADNIYLQGNVSDGGSGYAIQKQGGGTLNFTSSTPNTWTGGLVMANGNVAVSSTSSIGSGPLSFPGSNAATLTLNNTSQTISSLSSVAGAGTQSIALPSGGTLTINQAGNTTFGDGSAGLVDITDGSSTSIVEKQGAGTLTITTGGSSGASNNTFGTLKVTGGTVIMNPYTTVTSSATSLVLNGGTVSTSGITASNAETFTTLTLSDNSTIALGTNAHYLNFAASSSVTWASGKTLTITGWQGNYTNGSSPTGGRIYVGAASGNLSTGQLAQVLFYDGTNYYYSTQTSSGEIVPNGIDNTITDYYSNGSGNLDALSTWNTNTTGSGGTSPSSFTAGYQIFHLANSNTGTISGSSWTVSGTGSAITLDQGADLTIGSSKAINGTINVSAGRTLTISNATLPTLGTMAATSTVDYLNISGGISVVSSSTYGNVIFDGTSYTPGTGQTLNMAGNLTVQNSASINSTSSSAGVTLNIAGTGNQTITGNNNIIKLFKLTNNTNSTGTLTLASNTPITTVDNITLVQTGSGNKFSDGGNTLTVGNNLYMDGNSAGYNLTGTVILNAASGTALVANSSSAAGVIAATLNNFQINTTGTAVTSFAPTGGGSTINVAGTFTVASTTAKAIAFNANTINLGGNFTYNPSTDLTAASGGSIGSLTFSGTGAQAFTSNFTASPGINFGNWTVTNTSATVTLSAPVKATLITTINSGATLNLNGSASILNSAGSGSGLVNNGTISGTGEFKLTGTSLVPTISGTGSINILENGRTANINITSGTQTITDSLKLTGAAGTLTVASGAHLNIAPVAVVSWPTSASAVLASGTGGLVLKSDNTGTGRIDVMPSSSVVTGTVNIERYLKAQRGYRILSHPFSADQDIANLGAYIDLTDVSGLTGGNASICTSSNGSVFSYVPGTGWSSITAAGAGTYPAASSSTTHGNGVMVFVRGQKGEGCNAAYSSTGGVIDAPTVVTTGAVNMGSTSLTEVVPHDASPSTTAHGWNLISNPLPSEIDASLIGTTSGAIDDDIYLINPAGQGLGATTNGTQYLVVSISGSGNSIPIIPMNSGFLAHNSSTSTDAVLNFPESCKTSSSSNGNNNVFKTTGLYPMLELTAMNGTAMWDNWQLRMKSMASQNAGDNGDISKLSNTNFSLYSYSTDNYPLARDARDADSIADGEVIPLAVSSSLQTTYNLVVTNYTLPLNKDVYLHDKYTNTYVKLSNGVTYPLTISSDPASTGKNRLELLFNDVNNNTGVSNVTGGAGMTIVPNPATSNITVSYASIFTGDKLITIVNSLGQVMKQVTTADNQTTIPVDQLASGMYIIKTTVNGRSVTERFIKN